MLYATDQVRHEYHKSLALLQVVCQCLETELYTDAHQLRIAQVYEEDGGAVVIAVIESSRLHADEVNKKFLMSTFAKINQQFARTDSKNTVSPEAEDFSVVSVVVTGPQDFACLI